jgi:hypothetical protein
MWELHRITATSEQTIFFQKYIFMQRVAKLAFFLTRHDKNMTTCRVQKIAILLRVSYKI